jgi:DNA repair photolyase
MTAMRWAHLSAPADSGPTPLPLALPGATVRTFDTPGFAGMTFYEIHAKSIINRVPGASRVPFEWTINPYRGCSHACSYCLAGDTPILMADGSQRPLADLRAGDAVYGTVGVGADRHYVPTTVLDHWSTVRPAWRVRLADGTRLVASAEHRFLTDGGWRHVADGGCDRPHLRPGDRLRGLGRLAVPAKDTPDYRAGYLYGLVRGDAGLIRRRPRPHQPAPANPCRPTAVRPSTGTRQAPATRPAPPMPCTTAARSAPPHPTGVPVPAPRLAATIGAPVATPPTPPTTGADAPRADAPRIDIGRAAAWERADVYLRDVALPRALRWPTRPTDDWLRGFVAGLIDSAGRVDGVRARIVSQNEALLASAGHALARLGLPAGPVDQDDASGLPTVEIGADLRDTLRVMQATGCSDTPAPDATGRPVESDAGLRVEAIEAIGIDMPLYDITTGTGDFVADGVISHNCFARNTHTYLDLDAGHDFDSKVVVKVNAGELVRRELASPRWAGHHIAMGTNVDCYQRAEGRYRLMPQILSALRDFANPFSILTKGTLILRDLPLLRQAADVTTVGLSFSVGFVDEAHWRAVEPGTPSPQRRLDAVRTLTEAGFDVGVLMAPILPGLTDTAESIEETVAAIAAAGATSVMPLPLHLRPGAREWYARWLAQAHPDLVPRYRELFRAGSYLPQSYQREVTARVRQVARRYGLHHSAPGEARQLADTAEPTDSRRPAQLGAEQLGVEQLTLL